MSLYTRIINYHDPSDPGGHCGDLSTDVPSQATAPTGPDGCCVLGGSSFIWAKPWVIDLGQASHSSLADW